MTAFIGLGDNLAGAGLSIRGLGPHANFCMPRTGSFTNDLGKRRFRSRTIGRYICHLSSVGISCATGTAGGGNNGVGHDAGAPPVHPAPPIRPEN